MKLFTIVMAIVLVAGVAFQADLQENMEVTWNDDAAFVRMGEITYQYPENDGNGMEVTWNSSTAWVRICGTTYTFESEM